MAVCKSKTKLEFYGFLKMLFSLRHFPRLFLPTSDGGGCLLCFLWLHPCRSGQLTVWPSFWWLWPPKLDDSDSLPNLSTQTLPQFWETLEDQNQQNAKINWSIGKSAQPVTRNAMHWAVCWQINNPSTNAWLHTGRPISQLRTQQLVHYFISYLYTSTPLHSFESFSS